MIILEGDIPIPVLLKKGADRIQPEIVLAILVANEIYREIQQDLKITSVLDGQHMNGSLHYRGFAVDIGLPIGYDPELMRTRIDEALNGAGHSGRLYDVLFEKPAENHIHVEYDPK